MAYRCRYYPGRFEVTGDRERYIPGGFHPISKGDTFQDGRYRILHKLGHGAFATAWLAKDHSNDCYVALKVLAAEDSRSYPGLSVIDAIQCVQSSQKGRDLIALPVESFSVNGPNGNHLCHVFSDLGLNTAQLCEDKFPIPGRDARVIASQVAMVVSCLHSAGVAHGGESVML